MIISLVILFITGFFALISINSKIKSSYVLLFALPLGIGIHSFIFLILGYFNIYYNNILLLLNTAIISIISLVIFKKRKRVFSVFNDIKGVPIFYIVFLCYILYRMIIITKSTFINDFHWDEISTYQYISNLIFTNKSSSYMFLFFSPMNYFVGNMSYQFLGRSLISPRLFSPFLFIILSLFIYFKLKDYKVNKYIASLVASLFILSSGENIKLFSTFLNNVYYTIFCVFGVYLYLNGLYNNNKYKDKELGLIFIFFALLARREGFYHLIPFLIFIDFISIIKNKKIEIKYLKKYIPFFVLFISWGIFAKFVDLPNVNIPSETANLLISNLKDFTNLKHINEFGINLFDQMFVNNYYHSNLIHTLVFLLTLGFFVLKLILKKIDKSEFKIIGYGIFMQLFYVLLIFVTEAFLMKEEEFMEAASFSRYVLMVTPLSFVFLGILLFKNTGYKEKIKLNRKPLKSPKVLLIIPAYNEEKSILNTYNQIINYNKNSDIKLDVIVINDGSKDNTETILTENSIPHIKLIQNLGIGGAVQTGYKYAKNNNYDIAIQFDGDGQHDVNYVKSLIKPICDGEADMVIGSRFIDRNSSDFKSSIFRRIGIHIISFCIKYNTNKRIYDNTSGFRAVNKDLIKVFALNYPVEYPEPISSVNVLNDGYEIVEIPVSMNERKEGVSSIRSWKNIYYMINVVLSICLIRFGGENDE